MCSSCSVHTDGVWSHLVKGGRLKSPDNLIGADFEISNVHTERIEILPQGIRIERKAFESTIHYLRTHDHYSTSPCEIRSNNDRNLSGPLCLASRNQNRDTRCVNYILPILESLGIVKTDGNRPNKTWLVC